MSKRILKVRKYLQDYYNYNNLCTRCSILKCGSCAVFNIKKSLSTYILNDNRNYSSISNLEKLEGYNDFFVNGNYDINSIFYNDILLESNKEILINEFKKLLPNEQLFYGITIIFNNVHFLQEHVYFRTKVIEIIIDNNNIFKYDKGVKCYYVDRDYVVNIRESIKRNEKIKNFLK